MLSTELFAFWPLTASYLNRVNDKSLGLLEKVYYTCVSSLCLIFVHSGGIFFLSPLCKKINKKEKVKIRTGPKSK